MGRCVRPADGPAAGSWVPVTGYLLKYSTSSQNATPKTMNPPSM